MAIFLWNKIFILQKYCIIIALRNKNWHIFYFNFLQITWPVPRACKYVFFYLFVCKRKRNIIKVQIGKGLFKYFVLILWKYILGKHPQENKILSTWFTCHSASKMAILIIWPSTSWFSFLNCYRLWLFSFTWHDTRTKKMSIRCHWYL